MNFKKWKNGTERYLKEYERNPKNFHVMAIVHERCSAIRELLDESYEAILTEDERAYIKKLDDKSFKAFMSTFVELLVEDPEGMSKAFDSFIKNKGFQEGGEIDD